MSKFKLIDVGRGKFNGEVKGDEMAAYREARRHLASNGVDFSWLDDTHGIITAGFHTVGRFELIEE